MNKDNCNTIEGKVEYYFMKANVKQNFFKLIGGLV
jgi:hypothetical protein